MVDKRSPLAPSTEAKPELPSASLSAHDIYRLIQEAAYRKAEARQFAPGVELQDWLEAEKEVWERLEGSGEQKPAED